MRHLVTHEETNTERWVFEEGDIINALIEKCGIPLIGNVHDTPSEVSWDIDSTNFGIRSITIRKAMTTTDGEKEVQS